MQTNLKLSEKTQSILRTLCSNYRGDMRVKATFRCSVHYGVQKFMDEVSRSLRQLKRAKLIQSFYLSAEEIDEETDQAYFDVSADLNISVEEMAEVSINSQTVFIQRTEAN